MINDYIIQPDGVYLKDSNGNILAEMTFKKIDGKTYNIDHTFVDESLRGQGIADELVKKAVDYIQSQGFSLIASCPFAKKWLKRH